MTPLGELHLHRLLVAVVGALVGSVSSYVMHHAETAVFVAHAPRDG